MAFEMSRRLAASGRDEAAQVACALAEAQPVDGIAIGRDSDTQETLLLFEMGEDGAVTLRLGRDMVQELCGALDCEQEKGEHGLRSPLPA
jgi:hypothetical protein